MERSGTAASRTRSSPRPARLSYVSKQHYRTRSERPGESFFFISMSDHRSDESHRPDLSQIHSTHPAEIGQVIIYTDRNIYVFQQSRLDFLKKEKKKNEQVCTQNLCTQNENTFRPVFPFHPAPFICYSFYTLPVC